MRNMTVEHAILNALDKRGFEFERAEEYGEPGYATDKPILLANWNELNSSEVNAVERYFEIEWSDEWVVDEELRAFRTQPDCYGWQPSFVIHEGCVVGLDELISCGQLLDYIREGLGNNTSCALNAMSVTDELLSDLGCTLLVGGQESGLHSHMNDTPEKVLELVKPKGDWFFRIDATSQFSITFQLWLLPCEDQGGSEQ